MNDEDDELYEQLLQGKKQQIVEELDNRAKESIAVLEYKGHFVYVHTLEPDGDQPGSVKIGFTTFPPVRDDKTENEIHEYLVEVATGNAVRQDDNQGADRES